MQRIALILLIGLAFPLAACGGGGGGAAPATGPIDPPGGATDFTAFVKSLFDQTDDTSDPVEINDVTFTGTDNEDATAFDDVLQSNGG
ncbi:MAG: hypothetical protein QNJ98_15125 [Planctomycetota bacterium]|nr:hypothetical protein [Planctomycetota bacterium]